MFTRTHFRLGSWCFLVLPHERLYLEHLPNTEQYYKSFMHREVINYCTMTEYYLTHLLNLKDSNHDNIIGLVS